MRGGLNVSFVLSKAVFIRFQCDKTKGACNYELICQRIYRRHKELASVTSELGGSADNK